jgi:hypothetical protein
MRHLFLILFSAAAAWAQFQSGRLATNYSGNVVVIESTAALRGGTSGPEHILAFEDGAGSTMAVADTSSFYQGLSYPVANDHGDLRAYTLTRPPICHLGGCNDIKWEGVVLQSRDGWEVHRPGRAVISREGRWAAFSSFTPQHTSWLDLWTGDETAVDETLGVTAMADDGTLVTPREQTLLVSTPGREPRRLNLSFSALSALVDRTGAVTAVSSGRAVYRVDLSSGVVEDWAPTWDNVQLLGIDTGGNRLLFSQWNILYVVERGGPPRRLSEEGQFVYGAALTGDDTTAVASTLSGIVRYPLNDASAELVIPGATSFETKPAVLAPGLWLRMIGRGAAEAALTLNGQPVEPLSRTPSDLVWAVPEETATGSAELEIAQPGSPFAPFMLALPVQLAAPHFLIQRDLGEGTAYFADAPYIRHSDSGEPVNVSNPARPGESIEVLMTGLNHQGPAIEWLINRAYVDEYVRPLFAGERAHESNVYWHWVTLRLPEVLPGPNCWLSAVFGKSTNSASLFTSTGLAN